MGTPSCQEVAESIDWAGPDLASPQRKRPTPIDLSIQTQKSRDQDQVAAVGTIVSCGLEHLGS
jgi:hypothetical protein